MGNCDELMNEISRREVKEHLLCPELENARNANQEMEATKKENVQLQTEISNIQPQLKHMLKHLRNENASILQNATEKI